MPIFLNGGPFFIARRVPGGKWQVNEQGFETAEAAAAEIDALQKSSPEYEYSWCDISDMKPISITKTTRTLQ